MTTPFYRPPSRAPRVSNALVLTDALISRLARDVPPVSRHAVMRRLSSGLASGGGASALIVFASAGFRPDLTDATSSGMFWLKLAYGGAIAAIGLAVGERLVRPAGEAGWRAVWLLLPVGVIGLISLWQMKEAPPAGRHQLVFGASASFCLLYVILCSVAPLAGLVWAVRGLAPTRLALAGAVMGLAAGGAGAAVYALHCTEPGVPFLGIWYSLGVASTSLAGALLGPRILRW